MVEDQEGHSSLKWRERGAEPKVEKPSRLISLLEKYPASLNENTNPEEQYEFYEEVFR